MRVPEQEGMVVPRHPSHQHPPVYTLGLLLSLYLAQGLPAGFVTQALPAILRQYDVPLSMIGFTGLLLLPWAFKFLWAPLVDRHFSPRHGQSRTWIIPMQLTAALLVVGIGFFEPTQFAQTSVLLAFFAVVFVMNTCGATQDVATDGLAVRMLRAGERHWGNAMQVIGYRFGLIVGGGGLLLVLADWGWSTVFWVMAILIVLNTIPIARFQEPHWPQPVAQEPPPQDGSVTQAVAVWWHKFQVQFGYFWHNAEMRAWLGVLLVFKVADGLSSAMVKPMMVDMGYRLSEIGLLASVVGSASSLLGAGLGALLMRKLSRFQALIGFNALQAICTGTYAYAAWDFTQHGQPNIWLVFGANAVEHVAASMALVAILTAAMDYARPERAGSDFTFQVCMMTLFGGTGSLLSGVFAESLGYQSHFLLSAGVGLVLLTPMVWWARCKIHTP